MCVLLTSQKDIQKAAKHTAAESKAMKEKEKADLNSTNISNTSTTNTAAKGGISKGLGIAVVSVALLIQIALALGFYWLLSSHYVAAYPDFTGPAEKPAEDGGFDPDPSLPGDEVDSRGQPVGGTI